MRPRPEPLDRITPTSLASWERCPWSLGFARDPATAHLDRTGPRAALGIVAPRVVQDFRLDDDFEELWGSTAQDVYEDLALQWEPARPPAPQNWPGWALTKVRARRLCSERARPRGEVPKKPPPVNRDADFLPEFPWVERWLEDPTRPIAGKPDLVERTESGIRVVDLKTGIAFASPTPEHADQLLLYCGLVWSIAGESPVEAVILGVGQDEHVLSVTEAEIQRVRKKALDRLNALNQSHSEQGMYRELATPSSEACRWCPFRVVCDAFFDSVEPDWGVGALLLGTVQDCSVDVEGPSRVDMVVEKPNWLRGGRQLVNFPFPVTVQAGQRWGAVDFKAQSHTASAQWNTLVAAWDET